MKHLCIIVTAAALALLPRIACAGAASADSAAAQPVTLRSPGLDARAAQSYFRSNGLDPARTGYLSLSLSMSSLQWYTPPTRFEAVMDGAGRAATLGMFIGAVGNTLGWFDEKTTWWLTGSLATVGAVYAGTQYEPQPSGVRLHWSTSDDD
jgi:hypothetical protein